MPLCQLIVITKDMAEANELTHRKSPLAITSPEVNLSKCLSL